MLSQAEATKFEAWYGEKQSKIDAKKNSLSAAADKVNDRIAVEKKMATMTAKLVAAANEMAAEAQAAAEAEAAEAAAQRLMKKRQLRALPGNSEAAAEKAPATEERLQAAAEEAPATEETVQKWQQAPA